VLILEDGGSVLAVTSHRRHLDLQSRIGVPVRLLTGTAISVTERGKGGRLADESHVVCLNDIAEREEDPVIVIGMVHPMNVPSSRALERAGLVRDAQFEHLLGDPPYHAYFTLLQW
jgi:hypothetical protein